MPIINMISNNAETFPEGAYCPVTVWRDHNTGKIEYKPQEKFILVLYTSHHGLCLSDYERNGYDDSDFYMRVWNDEKQCIEDICFASTRGWTYPCYGSKPDATPEVRAKAEAWQKAREREARIRRRWHDRREANKLVAECNLASRAQLNKLTEAFWNRDEFNAVTKLLATKKFRSGFRESMANQIRAWLNEENPKYNTPLSPKQRQYLR